MDVKNFNRSDNEENRRDYHCSDAIVNTAPDHIPAPDDNKQNSLRKGPEHKTKAIIVRKRKTNTKRQVKLCASSKQRHERTVSENLSIDTVERNMDGHDYAEITSSSSGMRAVAVNPRTQNLLTERDNKDETYQPAQQCEVSSSDSTGYKMTALDLMISKALMENADAPYRPWNDSINTQLQLGENRINATDIIELWIERSYKIQS